MDTSATSGSSAPVQGETSRNQPSNQNSQRRRRRPRQKDNNTQQQQQQGSQTETSSVLRQENIGNSPVNFQNNRGRSNQKVERADPSRVVAKPPRRNPKNLSKRSLEIDQLKRGYPNMKESETDTSKFMLSLVPSDPDFPFDISSLQFDLYVPISYPRDPPLITVTNSDIPKGFSVNVDLGFRDLAKSNLGKKSLMNMMIDLDKNLETFLKQEKRETIKIVKFKHAHKPGNISSEPEDKFTGSSSETPSGGESSTSLNSYVPPPKQILVVPPEIQQAQDTQIEQLKHRLGSDTVDFISRDDRESIYSITLKPEHSSDPKLFLSLLPHEFSGMLHLMLQIPKAYNLEPCSIIITSTLEEGSEFVFPTTVIEANFNKNAKRHLNWTLLTHINFIACRLGKLMRENYLDYYENEDDRIEGDKENSRNTVSVKVGGNGSSNKEKISQDDPNSLPMESLKLSAVQDKARRILMALNSTSAKVNNPSSPPSTNSGSASTTVTTTSTTSTTSTSGSVSEQNIITETDSHAETDENEDEVVEEIEHEEEIIEEPSEMPNLIPRGVALLLPGLSMTNIGILECHLINLVVKCDRCSSQNDFFNVTSGSYGRESKPIAEECIKCKNVIAVSFRKNLIHLQGDQFQHEGAPPPVAGYLEFSGCHPFDMLASTYVPTCGNCVTTNNELPFKRVEKHKKAVLNCRECHIRMKLEMGDILFEKVSDDVLDKGKLEGVRVIKRNSRNDEGKQKLGIVSGTPLPDSGACTHYRKSRRWYRFSCCGKVFPCDKCHDSESNHHNEYATRIICGKCSREQNISSSCMFCHFEFQTRNTGFWEGGKGTRDPTKLNRNDTRKYKKLSTSANKTNHHHNNNNSGGSSSSSSNSHKKNPNSNNASKDKNKKNGGKPASSSSDS